MGEIIKKEHLLALLLIPVGYASGLMIIAIAASPDASLVAATNPIYIVGVIVGVSAFVIELFR